MFSLVELNSDLFLFNVFLPVAYSVTFDQDTPPRYMQHVNMDDQTERKATSKC